MHRNRSTQGGDGSGGAPPSEAWLFAQTILREPLPRIVNPRGKDHAAAGQSQLFAESLSTLSLSGRASQAAEAEALHKRELLEWAAAISTRAQDELRVLQAEEASVNEAWRRAEQFVQMLLEERNFDSSKHPRAPKGQRDGGQFVAKGSGGGGAGSVRLAGTFPASGATVAANQADAAKSPFTFTGGKIFRHGHKSHKAQPTTPSKPTTDASRPPMSQVPPRPSVNENGIEIAGAGPEVSESYKLRVQKALEILNPDVADWWKSNSVSGELRSRAAWRWQSKTHGWMGANNRPVVEVDQNVTPGEAAQAIIDQAHNGYFITSIGVYYKGYRFARSQDVQEFLNWQKGATAEAAHTASVLAELYVNSVATLTPAGDLVVTLGEVAEGGPRWGQLVSILPYVGHLPVVAIVLKLGKRQVRIPKKIARLFELLTEIERKVILSLVSKSKTDAEASAIVKREVARLAANRQVHHPISSVVHQALEKHPRLKGKYSSRDNRFESLARDLKSHQGYQGWHREIDDQVVVWLKDNRDATEAQFEKWLRWRYSEPDLKARFPKRF